MSDPATPAPFRLTLFGGFALKDSEGQPIALGLRKAEGLLAYIATVPDHAASRESLATLLWGDFAQAKARQNLRQTLLDLSKAFARFDPSPLRIGGQVISLDGADFWIDTREFEALVQEGTKEALGQALELHRGEFLAGVTVRAVDFESWTLTIRERYHELALSATTKLIGLQEEDGSIELAIATAKRALQLDPLREDFHRHLIRLYANNGMRAAAVAQYRTCSRLLMDELETDPDEETVRLYHDLVGEPDRSSMVGLPQEIRKLTAAEPAVPLHRREAEMAWTDPSGVLIGRRKEIASLSQYLLDMSPDARRCVLIEGETGIGKSHLVQSFLEGLEGAQSVKVAGRPEKLEPLGLWRRFAAALRARELERDLPNLAVAEVLEEFESRFLSFDHRSGTADSVRAISELIQKLMFAASGREGIFFVCEDLQWIDGLSLAVLLEILRRGSEGRSGFLLSLRKDGSDLPLEVSRILSEIEDAHLADRLVLAPLLPRHIQELGRALAAGLPIKRLSDARKKWVWEVSEGNPQVAIEAFTCLSLLPANQKPLEFQLPEQLQNRLSGRFALLSEPAQKLLACAAMTGRQAPAILVLEASGLNAEDLAQAVEELQSSGIATIEGDDITFRWNRLQFAAVNRILPQRRKVLHQSVCAALLHFNRGKLLAIAETLAHHSRGAEAFLEALGYDILAAQRTYRQGKIEAALDRFEALLVTTADMPANGGLTTADLVAPRISIQLGIAEAAECLSDHQRALAALTAIQQIAREKPDGQGRLRAGIIRARVLLQTGEQDPAFHLAAKVISEAGDRLQAGAWLLPDALLDRLHLLVPCQDRLASWLARRGREIDELGLSMDAVEQACMTGLLAGLRGDTSTVAASAERALSMAGKVGNPRLLALALQAKGVSLAWSGQGQAAFESLSEALVLAEACGDLFRLYLLQGFAGFALMVAGDAASAVENLDLAIGLAKRLGLQIALPSFLAWRAEAAARLGHKAVAEGFLTESFTLSGRINSGWGRHNACAAFSLLRGTATRQNPELGTWALDCASLSGQVSGAQRATVKL